MRKIAVLLALILCSSIHAQSVSLMPLTHPQFFDANGVPLAGGCLFTYAAGTSTPQATYTDSTGLALNTNPVILDSGGYANVWLANLSYKFVLDAAGSPSGCSPPGAPQWTVDNVNATNILGLANTFTAMQTFAAGITISPGQKIIAQTIGPNGTQQHTIPAVASDTLALVNAAQILTNKNINIATNTLTNTSNTAGNYPRNNGTTGYVDSPILSADLPATTSNCVGTYAIGLNAGGTPLCSSTGGFKVYAANITPVTFANAIGPSTLQTITIPANDIGAGQQFIVSAAGIVSSSATPPNVLICVQLDAVQVGCLNPSITSVTNQRWSVAVSFTGFTTGVTGSIVPTVQTFTGPTGSGTTVLGGGTGGGASSAIDTTISHTLQVVVSWSEVNVSDSITQSVFTVYRIG